MAEIRTVRTMDGLRACERLQFQVWHMPDYREVVPLHMLIAGRKSGGQLLGAFDGDRVIGFVFGFPGLDGDGRLYHYSHMLAVAPEVQGQGIGWQLKCAQREAVLAQGLDRICWTYDPLEAANAHLNITKLGALCRTYLRDLYGTMTDGLNAGLPSDRFQVDWWIATQRVAERLAGREREELLEPGAWVLAGEETAAGFRAPGIPGLEPGQVRVAVEIPADYQRVKVADAGLAMAWRLATRQALETCFASGYQAVGMGRQASVTGGRAYYILERDEEAS
jgi:predicted GNAT superfamily acetyltransferase